MGFGESPKSPSFKKDRRGWNVAWERDLATLYGSSVEMPASGRSIPNLLTDLPTQYYDMMLADAQVLSLQQITSQICVLQRDLTRKSSRRFAEDDFESHWTKRCSPKEREDFMLEGLVRACEASPDFEDHRKWLHRTFEITAVGSNPHPGLVMVKKHHDSSRTYLLTMVVWNILLAFYGESETYGLGKNHRNEAEALKPFEQDLSAKEIKRMAKENAANRRLAEHHCTSCNLPASKAGVETLSACRRCKAIDRLVYYCSKQCQVTDWKTGRPPHKTICGKKAALQDAFLAPKAPEPSPSNADDDGDDFFGPPEPGYVRSPALLHQLKLLKENPQMDYVLVVPDPHPDHGVILQDVMGSMFFKLCMKRAVTGPAPRDVFKMFQQLEPTARNAPGFGVAKLKQQLLKEYGFDVDVVKAQHYS
ncbi:hypothetical protein C8F04DRAFT_1368833 [Mycena alexandri]|uniref:MYND-type domain-containing protein n=1 Tax=Mycena alexandri TaxID=1745969 RepID=A0AAD6SMQ1_9AGAR|nr:hypothetical protein C8F04DRAFT_1368833 [Mycena alexandri]